MLSLHPTHTSFTGGGRRYNHPFFSLPPELHTQIFTCACTPSASSASTGPSYYEAFYTGLALSRVSKYVNAASAPARSRSVVLSGWREMVGFCRVLEEGEGKGKRRNGRVRYLTVMADEMPVDPIELLAERSLYPPHVAMSTSMGAPTSLPAHVNATIEGRQRRKERERTREKLMLQTLGTILKIVGGDLYELELGMQAVEHVKDPLVYLCDALTTKDSLTLSPSISPRSSSPSLSTSKLVHGHSAEQLCFSNLTTMFYACSPSGVYPWASSYSLENRFPCLFCPKLKDLTVVVCNEGNTSFDEEGDHDGDGTVDGDDANGNGEQDDRNRIVGADVEAEGEEDKEAHINPPKPSPFPNLKVLTLLASTPSQALAALNVEDWEVGSEIPTPFTGVAAPEDEEEEEEDGEMAWPPRTLETVVMCPKARWGERWESLRAVVESARGSEREDDGDERAEREKRRVDFRVLMPGEEF